MGMNTLMDYLHEVIRRVKSDFPSSTSKIKVRLQHNDYNLCLPHQYYTSISHSKPLPPTTLPYPQTLRSIYDSPYLFPPTTKPSARNLPTFQQFIIQFLSKLFRRSTMGLSVSQSRALKEGSLSKRDKGATARNRKENAHKETTGDRDKENLSEGERRRKAGISDEKGNGRTREEMEEKGLEKNMMGSKMSQHSKGDGSLGQSEKRQRVSQRDIDHLPATPTFAQTSSKSIPSSSHHPPHSNSFLPPHHPQPPFHSDLSSIQLAPNSKASRLFEPSPTGPKPQSPNDLTPSIVVRNVRGEEISRLDWQIQEQDSKKRAGLPTGIVMSNKFAEDHRYVQQSDGQVEKIKSRRQIMREVMAGRRQHPDQNFQLSSLCGQSRSIYGKLGLCTQPSYY